MAREELKKGQEGKGRDQLAAKRLNLEGEKGSLKKGMEIARGKGKKRDDHPERKGINQRPCLSQDGSLIFLEGSQTRIIKKGFSAWGPIEMRVLNTPVGKRECEKSSCLI